MPAAVAGYVESLRAGAAGGRVAAVRQVEACAAEADAHAAPDGFFATFPAGLGADAERAGALAARAYAELAGFLRTELLPQAPAVDAVGRERYALWSRYHVGADVDLDETYAWGLEEVARLRAEMAGVARAITGSGDVAAAAAALDADPALVVEGAANFRAWMQDRSDATVEAAAGRPLRHPPRDPAPGVPDRADDERRDLLHRPQRGLQPARGACGGRCRRAQTTFSTWREATTVHHEGVPGHHLQVGQTAVNSALLNRWRRQACWVSGHGEGWALYAERLMQDLGHLHGPGEVLGMLDGQLLRAGRVVLDVGVHCGLPAPAEVGGGAWTYEKAWAYLRSVSGNHPDVLRFELDRYLGWPGQAPSYKVGERLWSALRDDVAAAEGAAFDLRDFHRRALDVGSVGLDVLRSALLPA